MDWLIDERMDGLQQFVYACIQISSRCYWFDNIPGSPGYIHYTSQRLVDHFSFRYLKHLNILFEGNQKHVKPGLNHVKLKKTAGQILILYFFKHNFPY